MKELLRRSRLLVEPFLGLILVMLVFRVLAPDRPVSLLDLRTISVHTVVVGIAALGMTFLIVSGGIDLSVGSAIALTSVVAALVLRDTGSPLLALLGALATGGLCGLYNGLLVTVLRLPPFIATLGTLGFFRGVAKWLAGSTTVNADPQGLDVWVNPFPPEDSWAAHLGLAPAVWLLLLLVVAMGALLRYSILGKHTFAVGSSEATARLCGVRVPRVKVTLYVLAGLLIGVAGLLQFARLTQGDPTVAIGLELDVIAAVVIGGGSLAGGQGSVLGTLAGAFLMAFLRNRCTALGWPNYVQEMIVGHIIVLAVAIDQWRASRGAR